MLNISKQLVFLLIILILASCGGKKQQDETTTADESSDEFISEILISPVTDSPEFPDAILEMNQPGEFSSVDEGNVHFSYEVTNYELKAQTADAEQKNCANSEDGQHIHLILNNEPYTAHYVPEFDREIKAGHYVALSFISRSYHESLKHPEAYLIRQFTVGDAEPEEVDLSGPNLFYSRPKGTYTGEDTKKILLDFFLVNCELSDNGYKVRATINGEEFILDEWIPYFVEGLPMGENLFKLELLDPDGNLVDSPFNSVTRAITLSPKEPA